MKPRIILIAVAAVLVLSLGAYFGVRRDRVAEGPAPATPLVPLVVEQPTRDFLAPLVRPAAPARRQAGVPLANAPGVNVEAGMLPWEKAILEVLNDPDSGGSKGARLLALLPTLPEEALAPATEQALEWVRDPEYAATVLPLLVEAQTHGAVLGELYRDLMERPDPLVLPALLAIARNPQHPYAAAAHENLSLLLGQELETDWNAWDGAIRQRLAGRGEGKY